MKKVISLICLICLAASMLVACGGAPGKPEDLVGKTYIFDDMDIAFDDSLDAAEKQEAEEQWKSNKNAIVAQYKDMDMKFSFKANGVLEATAKGEETLKGTYGIKDGKWYITISGETSDVEFSGNQMRISESEAGITRFMIFVVD